MKLNFYGARFAGVFCLGACVAWPWLNPWATGPSAAVLPLLFSLACAALLCAGAALAAPVAPACKPGAVLGSGMVLALTLGLNAAFGRAGHEGAGLLAGLAVAGVCAWAVARGLAPWGPVVAGGWLAAALLSTAMGLLQYFHLEAGLFPWVNLSTAGEAFANLRQRNQFASLTTLGLVALVFLNVSGARWRAALPVAALLALGTAASASRTGLLQLGCLVLLALWWHRSWRAPAVRLMLLALAVYVLAALALPELLAASGRGQAPSVFTRLSQDLGCSSRGVLWANVLHLIAQHPLTGWGWGELDHAHYMTLYDGPRFCDILDNAHNLPLHLAVELGLPFTALLLGGLGWAVWRARPWGENEPRRQMAWAVLLVIGLHSLLEYPLWYGPFQMAAGLAVGLLWPRGQGPAEPANPAAPAVRWAPLGVALALLACTAYAAWDYHRIGQIYQPLDQRDPAYRDDATAHARASWLFRNPVAFADLSTTALTPANAAELHRLAGEMLHYSPEPRVIEKRIESAVMLGLDNDAIEHMARYRAAFPAAYAAWLPSRQWPALPEPE